jgi:hypothetical protein
MLILGSALAILIATCSAEDKQSRVKHSPVQRKSPQSVAVGKTPTSATAESNLRRLEQQSTRLSAPQKVKRTQGKSPLLMKTQKEKPAPPIRFSGSSNSAKGPGTTAQGTNPYRGRLRQKGTHH